jgi:3-isopropylmalate/(R)-2-methylmalate dehydratase large subunit
MPTGVTAKDLCLTLLARLGSSGASGAVIEYTGSVVSALSMEARLTLCNMSTELSAVSGVIAPDEVTLEYVRGRRYAPQGTAWEQAVDQWRHLYSDPGARFDQEIVIDGGGLAPRVTWGTSPSQSVALDAAVPTWEASALERDTFERVIRYMGVSPGQPLSTLAVDAAFIGSCTNSRLSDLRRAADVLRGRRVAAGVRAICVPGSMAVRRSAEAEGIDQVFRTAGFEWRKSGCSMCFFAGGESFGERERVISSTNRNFESRQGPQTRTHLASPETVAASAILGRIAGVSDLGRA